MKSDIWSLLVTINATSFNIHKLYFLNIFCVLYGSPKELQFFPYKALQQ
jgi:hypothetical protein